VAANIPEGQQQGCQQQSGCELSPRNLDGKIRWVTGGLARVSRRIAWAGRALGRGMRRGTGGIRWRGEVALRVAAVFVCVSTAIVFADFLFSKLCGRFGARRVGTNAGIATIAVPKIPTRKFVAAKVWVTKIWITQIAADLGSRRPAGFAGGGAEIRENRLLQDLAFAQGGEVVGYGFFFAEANLAGVSADETLVEDAAGKLIEVFVFEGTQHAGADFGGIGDGFEIEAAQLTLLAKFVSERSQGGGSGGRVSVPSACRWESS